jgi:hypothetical protein
MRELQPPSITIPLCHRICAWCRRDMGPLDHPSQYHSYGICEICTQRYFAYLYEPTPIVLGDRMQERSVGGYD